MEKILFDQYAKITNEDCYFCNGSINNFPLIDFPIEKDGEIQWKKAHCRCFNKARKENKEGDSND